MIGVLMSKKILIADDEQNIVISIEFLLRREGFEVLVAGDGEAALAKVRAERPDLVLLDVMMPRMNGFDVCQALRADPDLGATRILMLTAKGRDTEVSKGLGLGADGYMTKPFSTKELLAEVRKLLGDVGMMPARKQVLATAVVCLFLLLLVGATAALMWASEAWHQRTLAGGKDRRPGRADAGRLGCRRLGGEPALRAVRQGPAAHGRRARSDARAQCAAGE
jgi:two-component system alkaline phosphatase synthesis response regulator PhoP